MISSLVGMTLWQDLPFALEKEIMGLCIAEEEVWVWVDSGISLISFDFIGDPFGECGVADI